MRPLNACATLGESTMVRASHDGACYLLGYVVECCLKAVRLHDHAWRPASLTHDQHALLAARNQMMKGFGHKLYALVTTAVGPVGDRYVPDLPPNASIYHWREVRRYQAADPDAEARAASWMHWANHVYETTIVQMMLDGVL